MVLASLLSSLRRWGLVYAWTGRQFDLERNLQYNRTRWYDASIGRWLSQALHVLTKYRPDAATDQGGPNPTAAPTNYENRNRYFDARRSDVDCRHGRLLARLGE
jgi:RHS repeat-associated protein